MKMQITGFEGLDLEGKIGRCHVADGALVLDVRLKRPVGGVARARLDRGDVFALLGKALRDPAVLGFVLFGTGRRRPEAGTGSSSD